MVDFTFTFRPTTEESEALGVQVGIYVGMSHQYIYIYLSIHQ